ncbi:MAG: right-handed parallel beta-helix repeat-containing protein [Planctomycetota bacterium]|jgi:hypothetical protein
MGSRAKLGAELAALILFLAAIVGTAGGRIITVEVNEIADCNHIEMTIGDANIASLAGGSDDITLESVGEVLAEGFYYSLYDDEVDAQLGYVSRRYEGNGVHRFTFRGYLENKAPYELRETGLTLQFVVSTGRIRAFSYNNADHTWCLDEWWARSYGVEGQDLLLSMDRSVTDAPLTWEYDGATASLLETDDVTIIPFGDLLPGERAYRYIYFCTNGLLGCMWTGQPVSKSAHGPPRLTWLEIVGPGSIAENSWVRYKALAHLEDDTTRDVTGLAQWWVEPDSVALIYAGLLETTSVDATRQAVVYARYSEGGITAQAQAQVEVYPHQPVIINVPSDWPTIQEAINAATNGEVVVVSPGVYTGPGNRDIDFLGKAITVRSIDPRDPEVVATTVIDCNATVSDRHRGFFFHRQEGPDSILAGLTITNARFLMSGGAICCLNESSPTITRCTFSANWSAYGGAIGSLRNSNPSIYHCEFIGNTASDGGAIFNSASSPIIYDCGFRQNTADSGFGGAIANGWYPPAVGTCELAVINCRFEGNQANRGGGAIDSRDGTVLTLTDCILRANRAGEYGGGVSNQEGRLTLTNCMFIANSADDYGGAIAGLESNINLANCTFSGNLAPEGGTLACDSYNQAYPSFLQATNCILWDSNEPIWNNDESTLVITYSDVWGGWPGQGNIDANPCFAFEGDYHLTAESPCVDGGTNTVVGGMAASDFDGNPRPADGDGDGNSVADIGAHEYNPIEPSIAVSELEFSFIKGHTSDVQRLQIRNCGGGTLDWQAVKDCNWFEAAPANGVSIGDINEVRLTVDCNGLSEGHHNCVLTIFDQDAMNSPVTIGISLYIPRILHVPADYDTIQEAIDDAEDFDIVIIAPGTYTGEGNRDLDFEGKRITVRSTDPTNREIVAGTIIDCNGSWEDPHRGFYFHSGEDANSVLDGLTVINGCALAVEPPPDPWPPDPWPPDPWPPWMQDVPDPCTDGESSSQAEDTYDGNYPTSESLFVGNYGGGVFCEPKGWNEPGPGPTIKNCIIRGNSNGAIFGSSGPILNCRITANKGPGLGGCFGPIVNCIISGNRGDGIIFWREQVSNCTVTGNVSKPVDMPLPYESDLGDCGSPANCIVWAITVFVPKFPGFRRCAPFFISRVLTLIL